MIKITFPDGSVREYNEGVTGLQIAESISSRLAQDVLACGVNGETIDLSRPINEDANFVLYKWEDEQGKHAFWHTSAHLLAEALQELYPGIQFGIGPAIENGFYYDVDPGEAIIKEADLPAIEAKMAELAAKKEILVRQSIAKEDALKKFGERGETYKCELISELEDGHITTYTQGAFTDLCRGPHLPSTAPIKAIKLLSVAGAYWRGQEDRKQMTRIYGITFPKKKMLDEYLALLEEAKKRDHRKLGKELGLFMMSEDGPGFPFFLPKGMVLKNTLLDYWREIHKKAGYVYKKVQVLGPISHLETFLAANTLDEIVITLSIGEYANLEQIVAACEKSGVHTKFIPDYNNIIPTIPYMEDLQGLPVIHIRHVPLTSVFNATIKRMVDICGALFGIILFSPLMLLTAALIKLTSPGPIIYSQERIGLHNRPFKMFKFRSMEVQDPNKEKNQWTTPHDPRVTPVGRFIRKTSIDEMPQFFNILIGDMSLVGPRPERPLFVEKFKEEIPRYMIKHQVRPGLTGWAQVNGYRGDTSITKRIEHDLYYIENWSLGFDFKIMFLTIFKGFINKNAY